MELPRYVNPDLLSKVGRKIFVRGLTEESYELIVGELRPGEHLYGWLDPIIGPVRAPLLNNDNRYRAFFKQYREGIYPTFDFYAVLPEALRQ